MWGAGDEADAGSGTSRAARAATAISSVCLRGTRPDRLVISILIAAVSFHLNENRATRKGRPASLESRLRDGTGAERRHRCVPRSRPSGPGASPARRPDPCPC